jgi:acid phosphatase
MRLRIFPVLLVPLLLTTIAFAQTAPASNHIVVVALENQSYEDVVGSPAMPYLNSLISQGALATKYFANIHGSLSNYFMATTGELVTNDDGFQERSPSTTSCANSSPQTKPGERTRRACRLSDTRATMCRRM